MKALLIVIGVAAVLYLLITWAMFQLICRRFEGKFNPLSIIGEATSEALKPYADQVRAGIQWIQDYPTVEVEITSFDGLKLRGTLFENPRARGIMIGCHGYRSTGPRDFSSACTFYHGHDLSLLLIDERGNGRSEGKYITLGVRERRDVADWCRYIQARYPHLPILLTGISMGAATVMMSAPDLPANVGGIVADCGYASPRDEVRYILRHYLHLPAGLFLVGIDLWARLLGGFSLRDASAEEALTRNDRPVFFIHGQADELVPHDNLARLETACKAPFVSFSVPNTGHGMSYLVDHEGYKARLAEFLKLNVLSL